MASKRLWTRQELVLALNLYLKLPFGKLHSRTTEIIHLAGLINRTPGSVAMRLNNFASVDPYHQQRGVSGLAGGKKQVQPIWDEFIHQQGDLLFESERILAELEQKTLEDKFEQILCGTESLKGESKIREVKTRVNQHVFRQMVMANYTSKCAITGIDLQELLVASHIVPWSVNVNERLNPANGICLSALYDKAFDRGLISINTEYEIRLSKELENRQKESYYIRYFAPLMGLKIQLPAKYLPNKEFLEYHYEFIFRK
ncbi:HNH endonuclease [Catalinimonas niigatensis]|uniref:HNH endonuclease n=1 Tax=Catalinimonas niigatensis TaxID=1397264 RepID=UPI00266518F6|nr:HNH endonuclease [Catalinimonas niigatensis]WPP48357.1 HNH endonuclease [Catalinimonas niigatensis]